MIVYFLSLNCFQVEIFDNQIPLSFKDNNIIQLNFMVVPALKAFCPISGQLLFRQSSKPGRKYFRL